MTILEDPHEQPPPNRIPVSAAKAVAEQYRLRQCLLIGWDGAHVHVVTYGQTKADCAAAAKAQEFWCGHIREFSFEGGRAAAGRAKPEPRTDATWFWEIVDRTAFAPVPSDERDALSRIIGQRDSLRQHLNRVTETARSLAQDHPDPGTEALSAIYCAEQALYSTAPPSALTEDQAIAWITANLTAFRRDSGSMEYTLRQVVRAMLWSNRLKHTATQAAEPPA